MSPWRGDPVGDRWKPAPFREEVAELAAVAPLSWRVVLVERWGALWPPDPDREMAGKLPPQLHVTMRSAEYGGGRTYPPATAADLAELERDRGPLAVLELVGRLWRYMAQGGAPGEGNDPQAFNPPPLYLWTLAAGALRAEGGAEGRPGELIDRLARRLWGRLAELVARLPLTAEALEARGLAEDDGLLWLDRAMVAEVRRVYGVELGTDAARERWSAWERGEGGACALLRPWLDPEAEGPVPAAWAGELARLELEQLRAERARLESFQRRQTQPGTLIDFPLGVDPTAVQVATALAGLPAGRGDTPVALAIQWDDGAQGELDFSDEGDGPLIAVSKHYGPVALAHLWAAICLHWASGRASTDAFPWYPADHLWLLAQGDGARDHAAMHEWVERLGRCRLVATYRDGGTVTAPLVRLELEERDSRGRLVAGAMRVHPALAYPAAEGAQWWPARLDLVRSIPRGTRAEAAAAPLAVLMGQQWSITAKRDGGPIFRKRLADVATAIGRPVREDRRKDTRTESDVDAATTLLVKVGFAAEGFTITEEGVLIAHPAGARDSKPQRPPRMPATGAELGAWCAAWCAQSGGSLPDLARELGVNVRTLKRGCERGGRYLPVPLHNAIRAYLWREGTPTGGVDN